MQKRVLLILSGFEPPFILGGGGALAIYLGHRKTRDLDLFWEDTDHFAEIPVAVRRRLEAAALSVSVVQESPAFVRLRVADQQSSINLDLVADPTPRLERPARLDVEGAEVVAESRRDLLVNKLCALLSRSEIRDLIDVEALVADGVSLDDAIRSAPAKDGGFSPLTLAWVLENLNLTALASATGVSEDDARRLDQFRERLLDRLISGAS